MAHRDDHQAALQRVDALTRELKRERARTAAAERRAKAAEEEAARLQQLVKTPIEHLADRSEAGAPSPTAIISVFVLVVMAAAAIAGLVWRHG